MSPENIPTETLLACFRQPQTLHRWMQTPRQALRVHCQAPAWRAFVEKLSDSQIESLLMEASKTDTQRTVLQAWFQNHNLKITALDLDIAVQSVSDRVWACVRRAYKGTQIIWLPYEKSGVEAAAAAQRLADEERRKQADAADKRAAELGQTAVGQ